MERILAALHALLQHLMHVLQPRQIELLNAALLALPSLALDTRPHAASDRHDEYALLASLLLALLLRMEMHPVDQPFIGII